MISRRHLLSAAAGLALVASASAASAQQRIPIDFWHGLTQPLGGMLEQIAADFNASQTRYQVNATFRGAYPETMVAAIAAYRAGNAPHIVQMFEVGTATMMAARGAIVPVQDLMAEAGMAFNPNDYIASVRGYYSLPNGVLMSMPFNSSTTILFWNKDHFRRAGLNPDQPPRTWAETRQFATRLRAAGLNCPLTTAWPTWAQFEQFSAIHDVPLATKSNGLGGMDAQLQINSPLHVRHVQTLMDMQREGTFRYGGRDGAADALMASGECSMIHASSGLRARLLRELPGGVANLGAGFLPFYDDHIREPKNSIIGGASFWVMQKPGRTREEFRGVAEFFRFIGRPEVVAKWHTDTGFLPITTAGFEMVQRTNFYQQNPGADVPARQMLRTPTTQNSMGLRLGNMPEIRVVIQEELERALQGQQTAKQAMDRAVERGNVILRNFERANRGAATRG
jgi:sn-glycerol 3-phosphate transport system substrate-binding protein